MRPRKAIRRSHMAEDPPSGDCARRSHAFSNGDHSRGRTPELRATIRRPAASPQFGAREKLEHLFLGGRLEDVAGVLLRLRIPCRANALRGPCEIVARVA